MPNASQEFLSAISEAGHLAHAVSASGAFSPWGIPLLYSELGKEELFWSMTNDQ